MSVRLGVPARTETSFHLMESWRISREYIELKNFMDESRNWLTLTYLKNIRPDVDGTERKFVWTFPIGTYKYHNASKSIFENNVPDTHFIYLECFTLCHDENKVTITQVGKYTSILQATFLSSKIHFTCTQHDTIKHNSTRHT